MNKIELWKDRKSGKIDPALFSDTAEEFARLIAKDCEISKGKKQNKTSQIRKFYDEILRLNREAGTPDTDWDNLLPLVNMVTAKAAYARGRDLISDNFLDFIKYSIGQVQEKKDLAVFTNFFEAFYGFYKLHSPEK